MGFDPFLYGMDCSKVNRVVKHEKNVLASSSATNAISSFYFDCY